MSRKVQSVSPRAQAAVESLGDVWSQMMEKGYTMDFDVTMELSARNTRVGTLRVYGRLESGAQQAQRKK